MELAKILGIIGPNEVGKSTLFNVISGIYRPRSGSIIFGGDNITGLKPHKIVVKVLARTFQATTHFDNMSVKENMLVEHNVHMALGLASHVLILDTGKVALSGSPQDMS